ncbi:MAG: hypothetical protein [Bacteriophage sp.]|nr:MAG: hypothetical protein [Bacteriophage sp.]
MTREEALAMIVDALNDVEEFDEALTVLRTPTEDETTWKAKYNDLAEKYKTRFKEEIMTQNSGALEKPIEKPLTPEPVPKLDDLDFSGETE